MAANRLCISTRKLHVKGGDGACKKMRDVTENTKHLFPFTEEIRDTKTTSFVYSTYVVNLKVNSDIVASIKQRDHR